VAGGDKVLGLFVGTVTDLGHGGLSLKSSSDLYVSSGSYNGASIIVDVERVDAGWLVLPMPPSYPACRGGSKFPFPPVCFFPIQFLFAFICHPYPHRDPVRYPTNQPAGITNPKTPTHPVINTLRLPP
jgi:hypothetical protein